MPSHFLQQDLFIEAPVWNEGLTGRRRFFVEYYCTDQSCFLNATAAYVKAYSRPGKELTDASIQSNASRLMRDPVVREAVNKLLRARQNREDDLNEYRMLKMLMTLAFYDPGDIIDKYGNLTKDLAELGDLSVCVAGIKQTRNGKEIKLYDRTKAVEMLARYLEIIRPAEGANIINPNVYLTAKEVEMMQAEESPEAPGPRQAEDAEYEVVGDDNAGHGAAVAEAPEKE
jgi:phage terminase small subunit